MANCKINVFVQAKRNCAGDLEVWVKIGEKWLPCGIARMGRLDDVLEMHQKIRTMKRSEEMKIDAKMGVVIERPESVLPAQVSLIEDRGGVVLLITTKTGGKCSLLRLDDNGVTLRSWHVGALGEMGFATKRIAGQDTEYLAVKENKN